MPDEHPPRMRFLTAAQAGKGQWRIGGGDGGRKETAPLLFGGRGSVADGSRRGQSRGTSDGSYICNDGVTGQLHYMLGSGRSL